MLNETVSANHAHPLEPKLNLSFSLDITFWFIFTCYRIVVQHFVISLIWCLWCKMSHKATSDIWLALCCSAIGQLTTLTTKDSRDRPMILACLNVLLNDFKSIGSEIAELNLPVKFINDALSIFILLFVLLFIFNNYTFHLFTIIIKFYGKIVYSVLWTCMIASQCHGQHCQLSQTFLTKFLSFKETNSEHLRFIIFASVIIINFIL